MDTIECVLDDPREYPDKAAPEALALKRLGERLRAECDRNYGEERAAGQMSRT